MAESLIKRPVVLVVEDEFLIRLHATDVFKEAGFEVVEATNADDAIVILERRGDIRVVFTDIQMPGTMDGLKLAHAVGHRWPPVHIIATSGHQTINDGDLPIGSIFFPKPYSPHKVATAVHAFTAAS